MKIIQKYLCILAFTIALLCAAVYFTPEADIPLPVFIVHGQEAAEGQEISIFQAGEDHYYVFLPSYADLEQVTISLPRNHLFSLGDSVLSNGMDCGIFELESPYSFSMDNQNLGTIRFFHSENVATMYIDTVSGNMKAIHQNKEHKEDVSLKLYTADGKLNYSGVLGTLKGRGNVTWEEYDKRPYNLTLSADHGLLDMAPAANWVLLANAADETNLNNKLVFDLARRVIPQWTPDSRWVDLYLNGEYSGLYLLTEKLEVHESRLAIQTGSGDFLCKFDLHRRFSSLRNPFITEEGCTVEISYPKILTQGQWDIIEPTVKAMEQEIRSGTDLRKSTILDLDSWVRKYLIDEIFANIDSDLVSSYFYRSNGVFFGGPLWDYDMTLGNSPRNHDPYSFVARMPNRSNTHDIKHYPALYQNESFYNRMVELYRTEFLPELQNLIDGELDALIASIHKASQCNSLRWRSMYDNLPADVVHTPQALKAYLCERVQFLSSAWLDNIPYCTLQFEASPGSSYLNISVEKGTCLETAYINTEQLIWVDSVTGEAFDFSQPVMSDAILTRASVSNQSS